MHTDDLDALVEDLANVVAWEWADDEATARVFVTQKVDPDDLDESDLVANAVADLGVDTDVVSIGGEITPEVLDTRRDPDVVPFHEPTARHRPVEDGVSEINAESTAATAGWYEAVLVDPDAATWANYNPGEPVRLSNNHVYARSNEADLLEPIIQPSPHDGGSMDEDTVGLLAGYVPIEDGVTVDIAARTVTGSDSRAKHDLGDEYGTAIRRENYDDLRYSQFRKTGRTTGVTTGTVLATNATVNVRYPNGSVRLRDCLIASGMSQGGDSGSDVFADATGEYVGALFAGSPTSTIICKASNIEAELGVKLQPLDGPGGDDDEPAWRRLIRKLFGWL